MLKTNPSEACDISIDDHSIPLWRRVVGFVVIFSYLQGVLASAFATEPPFPEREQSYDWRFSVKQEVQGLRFKFKHGDESFIDAFFDPTSGEMSAADASNSSASWDLHFQSTPEELLCAFTLGSHVLNLNFGWQGQCDIINFQDRASLKDPTANTPSTVFQDSIKIKTFANAALSNTFYGAHLLVKSSHFDNNFAQDILNVLRIEAKTATNHDTLKINTLQMKTEAHFHNKSLVHVPNLYVIAPDYYLNEGITRSNQPLIGSWRTINLGVMDFTTPLNQELDKDAKDFLAQLPHYSDVDTAKLLASVRRVCLTTTVSLRFPPCWLNALRPSITRGPSGPIICLSP